VPLLSEDYLKIRETVSLSSHVDYKITTFLVENLLINLRETGICIPQPEKIFNYLLNKIDMVDFLDLICNHTLELFQDSASITQLSLELYNDVEIEDSYLTLYIRQNEYEHNIFEKIDKICDEFQDQFSNIKGWLLITSDFKPIY
jgi:hypothetical protein